MPAKKTSKNQLTLEGIRDKMARLGITQGDIAEAVKWARKKTCRAV